MNLLHTKTLLAILATLAVIAGVVGRLERKANERDAAMAQFQADVRKYAEREGYGLGDVSKTIRRMPK